uniref:Uncharacterized protein LOC105039867 isoform X3 n=1 Tax=Elaeis guineensis var. tenera TaxID=51953 RepID=A0A8N4IDD7_ELAGV|nr:uncharacterized protein LOC105039867 isoform X3 [Elaeis guineensis]
MAEHQQAQSESPARSPCRFLSRSSSSRGSGRRRWPALRRCCPASLPASSKPSTAPSTPPTRRRVYLDAKDLTSGAWVMGSVLDAGNLKIMKMEDTVDVKASKRFYGVCEESSIAVHRATT